MNDVEKLVSYNNIRAYLSEADQKDLIEKLGLDSQNLTPRLRGLNTESEFFLILHSLECCKHILSFDESTSVLTGSYSPDTLVVLKESEKKILVEIKSKEELKYKISGGNLQNRIDFADEFGYPLYFAVKLDGYWGLYHSDYLKSKGGKLEAVDLINSDFEEVFSCPLLIFPKGIKVVSTYSKHSASEALVGIKHPDYGNLIKYEFFFGSNLIFKSDDTSMESKRLAINSIVLENLHDTMSNQSQKVDTVDSNTTTVTEELIENTFFYEYYFLLSHIKHTVTQLDSTYDMTTYFKDLVQERGNSSINKKLLDSVIAFMIKNGLPIKKSSLKKANE